jgi:hypothetical protein
MSATWLLGPHGLSDQVQLRSLNRAKLGSATCLGEKVSQEITLAANFRYAAIREVKNHWVCDHTGFERPNAFFKFHTYSARMFSAINRT